MGLTAWFQSSVYLLAALAATMLAVAEGRPSPQMLTPLLALAAWWWTERRRRFVLSTLWANALGVFAICIALAEFVGGGVESRLLSGAHLLVYSTWTVFFQKKTIRLYWWLCALCVLQVAVGAVLTNDGLFGALLILFVFLSVWTLSLFSLDQARERVLGDPKSPPIIPADDTSRMAGFPTGDRAGRRHRSLGRLADIASRLRAPADVQGSIQFDPRERWIHLRFAGGTLLAGCVSMAIGAVFFAIVPRIWLGRAEFKDEPDDATAIGGITGFSDSVQLGSIGTILTSSEPVLHLSLYDNDSDARLDVYDYAGRLGQQEPLLRGGVLANYRSDTRSWGAGSARILSEDIRRDPGQGMVRQMITLEPMDTDVLFALHPVRAASIEGRRRRHSATRDVLTSRLFYRDRNHRDELSYVVYSPANVAGETDDDATAGRLDIPGGLRRYTQPPDDLPELMAAARRVADLRHGAPDPPPTQRASRLLAWLRDSGEFSYTLDQTPTNRSLDPVEDFVLYRKAGHCEYFASALALMLRAVGVPSRLVNGFKGGQLLDGGVLEVQRRHAHAWVEAYLDGRWQVLDPTPPAARAQSVESQAAGIRSLGDLWHVISTGWTRHVVNMDLRFQYTAIYQPVRQTLQDVWASLHGNREKAATLLASVRSFLSSPRRWFSWQGGLATFLLLLLSAAVFWCGWGLYRLLRAAWRRWRGSLLRSGRYVEFFERFQRICRRYGFSRGAAQTPREFAVRVAEQQSALLAQTGLADFPIRLVELFYQVRFGGRPLDAASYAELDRRLGEFDNALASRSE